MRIKKEIIILSVLAGVSIAFADPILHNGSFETTQTAVRTELSGVVDGWVYSPGSFRTGIIPEHEASFAGNFDAVEGTQFGYMWCGSNDAISQVIAGFDVGQEYQITWSQRVRETYSTTFEAMMDTTTLSSEVVTDGHLGWTQKDVSFTATATSHTLRFRNAGAWDTMMFVDDVSITAIPEPATLGTIALVGGGILWIRKRLMI